jgi:hypothetical protein
MDLFLVFTHLAALAGGVVLTLSWQKIVSWVKAEEAKASIAAKADVAKAAASVSATVATPVAPASTTTTTKS